MITPKKTYIKNILITGGDSRFANELKKSFFGKHIYYRNKKELDILKIKSLENNIRSIKPKIIIHLAGLTRPMKIHENDIISSINLNIIGTANLVKICSKNNIKLIYFSTHFVYPCKKGNYKENDPLFPINNYAWSKLGGEASVQLYENSLILRLSMSEYPFVHKSAFVDTKSNFIYNTDVAKILPKILNIKGVLNIGGKKSSIYNFAKKSNPQVNRTKLKKNQFYPKDSSTNIEKMHKILKKK